MDRQRFDLLLRRMERSNVASPFDLVGCTEQEIACLEARYGLRLPETYAHYLRVMGHKSGRLFTCDHMAVSYRHVLEMTAGERLAWTNDEGEDDGGPPPGFNLPADALLIAGRLGDQFQFVRCSGQGDSPVWYFNTWAWQVQESEHSVLSWLEGWCERAENAIAQGYFDMFPEGTIP